MSRADLKPHGRDNGPNPRLSTVLATLSDDLTSVVRETLQPEHVGLWLRPETGAKKRGSEES